jgi:DNA gyrase/topoisomerase IV subunit A
VSADREETRRARERLEILGAILRAVDEWDRISAAVAEAEDRTSAVDVLRGPQFGFSDAQAYHVVDMRQSQRTKSGREAIVTEILQLRERLAGDT